MRSQLLVNGKGLPKSWTGFFTFLFLITFLTKGYCEDLSFSSNSEEANPLEQKIETTESDGAPTNQFQEVKTDEIVPENDYEVDANPKTCCQKVDSEQPVLEVKVGYFFFSDSKMRKVFNEGGLDVQLCGSYPIYRWLHIYGSVEYLERHGRSLHGRQKASIWEVPLSLGLKPVIKIYPKVRYYFTLGPRYFFVHAHNKSSFVDRKINQNGLGGFVNTGFNFLPLPHLLIDVFGEYSYKRMDFHHSKSHVHGRTIQVGGFALGLGLGYAF